MKKVELWICCLLLYEGNLPAQFKNTANTYLYITSGSSVYLSGLDFQNQSNATVVHAGALIMAGNSVGRDIQNNGTFSGNNGTIRMQGTTEQQIQGDSIVNIGTFVVNNAGNGVSIPNSSGLRIHGNLNLSDGKLFTANSSPVYFTNTASNPVETNTNHIVGTAIMESRNVNTSAFGPFLHFSMPAGDNVGNLTLTRRTGNGATTSRGFNSTSGVVNPIGFEGLAVHWLVNITNLSSSLTRDPQFSWLSAWDNSKTLTSMQLWHTSTPFNISLPWSMYSAGPHDISTRSFSVSNVPLSQLYNAWTFSDIFNPLPALFLMFDVKKQQNSVLLVWKVSYQVNVSYYVVERSISGTDFQEIGRIAPQQSDYVWHDDITNVSAAYLYYRVKAIQYDDAEFFTSVKMVMLNETSFDIIVYPNPCQMDCKVYVTNPSAQPINLTVYDNVSRFLGASILEGKSLEAQLHDFFQPTSSGVYILKFENHSEKKYIKLQYDTR